MSSRNKKTRSTRSNFKRTEVDKISDLPRDVMDQILSRLSIKDMVKTSALSTKWRYKWASVPTLVFDDQSFRGKHPFQGMSTVERLARRIDRILMLHLGPIHKFKLSYKVSLPFEDIDKWILYLSRRSIKELELHISKPDCYDVPSCLFSCRELTHLDLSCCSLPSPSMFEGFNNLKSLTLENIVVAQRALEKMISSSPLLETLTLTDLDSVDQLNTHGPNLLLLDIRGQYVDVRLKNTSRLTELYIDASCFNESFQLENPDKFSDLIKLMAGIPQITRLMIGGFLIEYLAAGYIPRELPVRCDSLTYLNISLTFAKSNEVSALLCLLRSAPNLEDLQICSCWEEIIETGIDVWEWDAKGWETPFTRLRHVKIYYFGGMKDEMAFVKFMLLTSPALKSMTIELDADNYDSENGYNTGRFEMLKSMLSFKRASTEAEISFSEHFENS